MNHDYPERTKGMIDVILDTDTYNEIDDQFAVAYMLHAEEKIRICGITAAPFLNERAATPGDGMEKSYQEILKLLTLAGREDLKKLVFRGAVDYMPDEQTPALSDAAKHIVNTARRHTPEHPLYIASIACITNVASALVMAPDIRDKVVVVWLGGHARHWPIDDEFNLKQDIPAARVLFGCGVRVVHLPARGVVDHLSCSKPELAFWLKGKNPLCDYLYDFTIQTADSYANGKPWTRVIWDISAIAWLLDEDGHMMQDRPEHAPIPQADFHDSFPPDSHLISYVWQIDRDAVFEDLFRRLTK